MRKTLIAVSTTAILSGTMLGSAVAQDDALETQEAKISYGLGMMIGERILKQYGDLDYDLVIEAMKAQHAGEETRMSMEDAQMTLQAQQQEAQAAAEAAMAASAAEARAAGDVYLAENAAREGVTTTDSGLQYEILTEGEGDSPAAEDTVSVHYVGTLMDGTEFDSSVARGEPVEFALDRVIPGWTEGVQLMNVGSKYRFVLPADLAYGDNAPPSIGPGQTLIFEVELLEIK